MTVPRHITRAGLAISALCAALLLGACGSDPVTTQTDRSVTTTTTGPSYAPPPPESSTTTTTTQHVQQNP